MITYVGLVLLPLFLLVSWEVVKYCVKGENANKVMLLKNVVVASLTRTPGHVLLIPSPTVDPTVRKKIKL